MANDLLEVFVYPNGGGAGQAVPLRSGGSRGTEGRWQRNQPGTGQVTVPKDDPLVASLQPGALLETRVNGVTSGHVVRVERTELVDVADGEYRQQEHTAAGFGLLTEWDDSILAPVNGWDRLPFDDTIHYDFTHPDFDDSGWGATVYPILPPGSESPSYPLVVQRHSLPMEQPDPYAQWVATRLEDTVGLQMPVGSMFFRLEFTVASDQIVIVYPSADDTFLGYLDGVLVVKGEDDPGFSFADTWRSPRRVSAGTHVLAFEVRNFERPFAGNVLNITGFLCSLFGVDSVDGILDETTFIAQTGTPPGVSDGWKCFDALGSTVRPGWTFGAMCGSVLTRAHAGGEMSQWVLGFTPATDSAGAAWDLETEFDFPTCGQLWSDVLAKCADTHVDLGYTIDLTSGVRTLLAWNKGTAGSVSGVTLATGDDVSVPNIAALSHEVDATAVVDRLAYRHSGGWSKVEQTPAAGFPRRAAALKLGATQDPQEAARIAQVTMTKLAAPQRALRVRQDTTGSDVPCVNYQPHDTVILDGEACVVDAISWSSDDIGMAVWVPELLDPVASRVERTEVVLRRMTAGSLGGRSQAASPAQSDVDGLTTSKLPKYRDLRFSYSGTAQANTISGFSELKERRRLTNYLVTAQEQPAGSGDTITGDTTVNLYEADGTIVAFAVLPAAPNWTDGTVDSYRVEVRLGGGFYQEQTKFFVGIPTSGGHYNVVCEVASTDPL